MATALRWAAVFGGLILIGNFWIIRAYGDTLQSTHLFIVRGTVFYPLAYLNLVAGIVLLVLAALAWAVGRGTPGR